ncbi:MAG TPA: glycosyltransferase family 39 protein [Chitinophagaceae bacterium]|nr:glycosyltransferase family 39 protein [Chitinophagaceae bacterium]
MDTPFLSRKVYRFLFFLLGIVCLFGLFVPLMDNDSAHHANIALHMHLTGDYVSLVDHAGDYLDKPHLHFWLAAFSYKLFGVNSFAYKFPSFLFTILGVYSTFRLGRLLYDTGTGRLAALVLASSFAFMLANNDVRMDAILTASIAFATWQLVEFIQNKKILNVAGAALGLALGFCTKGHIAVFVPAVAALFYILYRKDWKILLSWKWVLLLLLFALFIAPVVYCYYLQFNRHPETIVRGKDHIDGVKFILFNQSVERFSGQMGSDAKQDYLFFLHSFLWAFAPWSILAYIALAGRIKNFGKRKEEWLTTAVFLVILLVVSFSGFKLPHYLNIVFPTTSVMVASWLLSKRSDPVWIKRIFVIQLVITGVLLLGAAVINVWAFPAKNILVIIGVIILLAAVFYFIKSAVYDRLQKAVGMSVAAMAFCFFLLNCNFYPKLLTYQGGNQLAVATKGKVDPADVYYWKDMQSSSFGFYSGSLRQQFADSVLQPGKNIWLLYDIRSEEEIKQAGYTIGQRYESKDYEITKIDIKFVNPEKREKRCTKMVLAEISK